MLVRVRAWVPLVLSCVVAASCGYYDASLLAPNPATSDAGTDGPVSGCAHALPPDKPAVTGAGGDLELVFAVRQLMFGQGTDAGDSAIGYDIDKTCTCQGEKHSCLEPSWAPGEHCDGPEGRDNAAGAMLSELSGMLPNSFGESMWNKDIEEGAKSVIIRIQGYNGQPDDDEVVLTWYMAVKYWDQHKDADGGNMHPVWDGTDEWPVRHTSLQAQPAPDGGVTYDVDHPKHQDTKAYVSGGRVVGMLPKGAFQADPSMQIVFTDPYLTAKVVNNGTLWELKDGVIAGVWMLTDIFEQFGFMSVQGMPVCTNSIFYPGVKGMVCKYADIYHARGTPTTPCDSLSIGLSFAGLQAKLGAVYVVTGESKLCTADVDPVNDTCDK
jgi:hypothetical protein